MTKFSLKILAGSSNCPKCGSLAELTKYTKLDPNDLTQQARYEGINMCASFYCRECKELHCECGKI